MSVGHRVSAMMDFRRLVDMQSSSFRQSSSISSKLVFCVFEAVVNINYYIHFHILLGTLEPNS